MWPGGGERGASSDMGLQEARTWNMAGGWEVRTRGLPGRGNRGDMEAKVCLAREGKSLRTGSARAKRRSLEALIGVWNIILIQLEAV